MSPHTLTCIAVVFPPRPPQYRVRSGTSAVPGLVGGIPPDTPGWRPSHPGGKGRRPTPSTARLEIQSTSPVYSLAI